MYAALRCVGRPSCRVPIRSAVYARPRHLRAFQSYTPYQQSSPPGDPTKSDETAGDTTPGKDRPRLARWRRRKAAELRHADESYMVVDPETSSVKIVDAHDTSTISRKRSRSAPPYQVPEWFIEKRMSTPDSDRQFRATWDLDIEQSANEAESKDAIPLVYSGFFKSLLDAPQPETLDTRKIFIDRTLVEEIGAAIRTGLQCVMAGRAESQLSARSAISLHCPIEGSTSILQAIINHIATTEDAIVMTLKAADFAQLGGRYVCPDVGLDSSLRTLGFDVHAEAEEQAEEEEELAEEEEEDENGPPMPGKISPSGVFVMSQQLPSNISDALKKFMGITSSTDAEKSSESKRRRTGQKPDDDMAQELTMDQARLSRFLNALIDSAWAKNSTIADGSITSGNKKKPAKLIFCVPDFIKTSNTAIGRELTNKLAEVVRRRRVDRGESIVLVGLSSDQEALESPDADKTIQWELDETMWRVITVLPHSNAADRAVTSNDPLVKNVNAVGNLTANTRNWHQMWCEMTFNQETNAQFMQESASVLQEALQDADVALIFKRSILTQDEIHRLLTASLGRALFERRNVLKASDVQDAVKTVKRNDARKQKLLQSFRSLEIGKNGKAFGGSGLPSGLFPIGALGSLMGQSAPDSAAAQRNSALGDGFSDVSARLQVLQQEADRYEKRLINGIVLPEKIKTTFKDVHVAKATTEAVRDLTGLALQRPDAFKYGILASNTLSGLLLYGPPGTGKTMLAKAVAKEAQAAVLTVTGSDVNQMWVGESEKTVKAIFSLARKLSPCVVFIDEADALLASRGSGSGGRGRPNHRDTINQFLLEWDGMNETGVFLMVATNRPFDLDDAVLRRLPRRVLIDLPTKEDREAILKIHLTGEHLASDVEVAQLAEQTPYYSGSDLKNLVVSAALSAVKEELEAKVAADVAAKASVASESSSSSDTEAQGGQTYKFPEQRTLTKAHFDQALGEIGASVSGDMSSLRQIKKFDEQYGDRKGRRKKSALGFGELVEREADARVRA